MNPPATCIDELPLEMIREMFKYLSLKDLTVCSMVNKRWQSISKLQRLVVIDYTDYYYYYGNLQKWYDSNQWIREGDRCSLEIFDRLVEKPLLSNLKYLALCGRSSVSFNLDRHFPQLMHLEIGIPLTKGKRNVHWKFPKLRILVFHSYNLGRRLSIDCPKLTTLNYTGDLNESLLKVKKPETIRKFQTNLVGPHLNPFKSVECLVTKELRMISKATLLSLPKLREMHFIEGIENLFSRVLHRVRTVNQVKQTLKVFLRDLKTLGRWSEFQFRFCGFELTKKVKLDQIDFGAQFDETSELCWLRKEYVYMKNYELLNQGALDFVHGADYTALLSYVTGEFPRCFSQKFTNVRYVNTRGAIQDPDHFLWFLSSLKWLSSLKLEQLELSGLSQEFYDHLPASAHSLVSLDLQGDAGTVLQLNFDFIRKLPRFSKLHIRPPLTFESFTGLVRWLGRLEDVNINVQVKGECLQIWKERYVTKWKIFTTLNSTGFTFKEIFEAESLDESINYLKQLQNSEALPNFYLD